jgi:putative flippase GtrA
MQSYSSLFLKFVKFALVGFGCMLLDFSMTYFLKEIVKLNKYVSNSISFAIAVFVSYYLNRNWTFHNTSANVTEQFIRFLAVATIGLILNNLTTYFFTEKRSYNFYFSKILATALVVLWNFSMNILFTFAK